MGCRIPFPCAKVAAAIFLSLWVVFGGSVVVAEGGCSALLAEWDYIVVGAGVSGCALSPLLAADGSKSVLLLEAGGPMSWTFGGREQRDKYREFGGNANVTVFDVPSEYLNISAEGGVQRPEFYWPTVPWGLQGKGVGGSGSVNGGVAFTGSPEDYDTWPEGWKYQDLEPFFEEIIEVMNIRDVSSADGKIYLQEAMNDVLKNQLGFTEAPLNESPIRVNTSSPMEQYTRGGEKFEACKAFLQPALNTKDNIKLEVNSPVKRIIFSKPGIASGVELENGRVFNLNEGGKVVVTAGPFNTPKVLMYSGIGAASELERLDKSGLVHNPKDLWTINEEVGAGLHDHLLSVFLFEMPEALREKEYLVNFNDSQIFEDYFKKRSGPLAQILVPRLAFLAMPGRSAPDFEIGSLNKNTLTSCTTCLQFFMLTLRPTSKTRLQINTPDLGCSCVSQTCRTEDFCFPDVYFKNKKDLDEAVWALRTFIDAFEAEGFKTITPTSKDPAFLREWFVNQGFIPASWHFAGTCTLEKCTDVNMKLKGTENIFVPDSSSFPDPVRTHNVLPTIAIARKAAAHIMQ